MGGTVCRPTKALGVATLQVAAYVEAASKKSDFERTELASKHKSGVFTGAAQRCLGGALPGQSDAWAGRCMGGVGCSAVYQQGKSGRGGAGWVEHGAWFISKGRLGWAGRGEWGTSVVYQQREGCHMGKGCCCHAGLRKPR